MTRSLAEINAAAPARPEEFRLRFTDAELRTIDRALRVAIWSLTGKEHWSVKGRYEAIIKKIEERP